jgi:hypothetical protein
MNPAVESIEAKIWERVIDPDDASFPPEVAGSILKLGFKDADVARMNELSQKASEGTLTVEEQNELDGYEHIGGFLNILQAKARLSLAKGRLGS